MKFTITYEVESAEETRRIVEGQTAIDYLEELGNYLRSMTKYGSDVWAAKNGLDAIVEFKEKFWTDMPDGLRGLL